MTVFHNDAPGMGIWSKRRIEKPYYNGNNNSEKNKGTIVFWRLRQPRTGLNRDFQRGNVPLAGEDACGRRGRRPSETQASADCYFANILRTSASPREIFPGAHTHGLTPVARLSVIPFASRTPLPPSIFLLPTAYCLLPPFPHSLSHLTIS